MGCDTTSTRNSTRASLEAVETKNSITFALLSDTNTLFCFRVFCSVSLCTLWMVHACHVSIPMSPHPYPCEHTHVSIPASPVPTHADLASTTCLLGCTFHMTPPPNQRATTARQHKRARQGRAREGKGRGACCSRRVAIREVHTRMPNAN